VKEVAKLHLLASSVGVNCDNMPDQIVFYKRAIPADGGAGPYDSPIMSMNIPTGVPFDQALEFARKLFKEQTGSTPEEFGAEYRVN
jgi:hypothetical protein